MNMIRVITDLDFNMKPMEFNQPKIRMSARGLVFDDHFRIGDDTWKSL